MLLDISKIKVHDRIRKDFGNIEELAKDIEENGLINSPVVTPEFQLIAGERRLMACKHLGMNAIAVNVMTVRDYEHQLQLEISENENRKDFTFSERVEWAKRLEQVERLKAKDRMGQGVQNLAQHEVGKTNEIVAAASGFNNKETYRQAKFIADNADEEIVQQLNEKQITVHAAYQKLKKERDDEAHKNRQWEAKYNLSINQHSTLQDELLNQIDELKKSKTKDSPETLAAIQKLNNEVIVLNRKNQELNQQLTENKTDEVTLRRIRNQYVNIMREVTGNHTRMMLELQSIQGKPETTEFAEEYRERLNDFFRQAYEDLDELTEVTQIKPKNGGIDIEYTVNGN